MMFHPIKPPVTSCSPVGVNRHFFPLLHHEKSINFLKKQHQRREVEVENESMNLRRQHLKVSKRTALVNLLTRNRFILINLS